jgi:hypothetical protein
MDAVGVDAAAVAANGGAVAATMGDGAGAFRCALIGSLDAPFVAFLGGALAVSLSLGCADGEGVRATAAGSGLGAGASAATGGSFVEEGGAWAAKGGDEGCSEKALAGATSTPEGLRVT